uniref:SKI-interacting protein SKIP SNW domain-containing protein n=1 Tax=Oryza punctata TaxID=4537 RepID=A0A0E0L9D1_ORYPU
MALRLPDPTHGGGAPASHDHTDDEWFKERYGGGGGGGGDAPKLSRAVNPVPPYGRRSALAARWKEDFGDGGAFPEVHVAQYPLDMGRGDGDGERQGSSGGVLTLNLTVDGSGGRVAFDAVVRQGENAKKTVYSSPGDVLPKINAAAADDDGDENDEEQAAVEETTARTSAALRAIVEKRLSAVQPANIQASNPNARFIKYMPARQSSALNSGAAERIVRIGEIQQDPLEPPKFKHKRVPAPAGSPPVPVLRSPPRPLSQKDHDNWKVAPSISNWKNPKGYSIPLDKRAALDGRGLHDVQVSDAFAALAEALYAAERPGRPSRRAPRKARAEMLGAAPPAPAAAAAAPSEPLKAAERDAIREERRRERRLEARAAAAAGKKSAATVPDRDVSERIALGMANTGVGGGGEVTYDQRLFNQERGMDSGFAGDNVYSGRLFAAQPALSTLYKPSKHGDSDTYGDVADEHLEKIAKTRGFVPDKAFTGAPESVAGKRERPVEFDGPSMEEDPFHLDQFLTQMKGKLQ